MEEDEENQTENRKTMTATANNAVKEEEEPAAKDSKNPELKNSVGNKCDDGGVAETSFGASVSAGSPDSSGGLNCNFEVPVEYELHPFESAEKSQGKPVVRKLGRNKDRVGQTASAQTQNRQEHDPLEPSPTSVTQSISSIPSPSVPVERVSQGLNRTNSCVSAVDRAKSLSSKPSSIVPLHRTPSHDGYNWRKYGQKQVKSPQGSRSYYRCTFSDCYAKKIECSDHTNRVIEIVYRSRHNHDPPQKLSCMGGSKLALVSPVSYSSAHEAGVTDDSLPYTSSNDPVPETALAIDSIEPPEPSGSDENPEMDVTQEHADEIESPKKLKRTVSSCSESFSKPGKRSKVVVHASSDVYISGDGYRWRKYGQKMVKGNPHPRNYYRCTSAGCPVRKQIERAKDNTSAFVITYKGKHDHDIPVPKERHGLVTGPVVAGGSPRMNTSPVMKSEPFQEQVSGAPSEHGEKTGI